MKFTNGYWLLKEGVSTYPCVDVRDVQITPTCITLYAAPAKVVSRGQTLDGPLLTLTFTSPQEGILQTAMTHYWDGSPGPDFPINDQKQTLTTQETEDELKIITGKLEAVISKDNFQIKYFWDGRFLTASKPKQLAYMMTPDGAFCRERLQTSVDEQYYGFGERFTPFVKNGQTVDIWN